MVGHPNYEAVNAFLSQIPAIKTRIAGTERLDGVQVRNGYTAAWASPDGRLGFTAVSRDDGKFSAFFERVIAPGEIALLTFGIVNADAESAGRSVADLI